MLFCIICSAFNQFALLIRRSSIQAMAASVCQHLITVRLQNAEGVPHENIQRHSLEQEITLALILKSHDKSATQIIKWIVDFPMALGVSTATCWKMKRWPNIAYYVMSEELFQCCDQDDMLIDKYCKDCVS